MSIKKRMKHIDEHTLELFVLDAEEIQGIKRSISKHLAQCAGCRETHRCLIKIYADVDAALLENKELDINRNEKIVPLSESLEPWNKPIHAMEKMHSGDIKSLDKTELPVLHKIINFFWRKHPVAGSSAFIALLMLIMLALFYPTRSKKSPSYYYYNSDLNSLDIYSIANKLLWTLPVSNLTDARQDEEFTNISYTLIADLNNDGKNEVLTSLLVGNETQPAALEMYNSVGKLIGKFDFPVTNIKFRGTEYSTPLGAGNIFDDSMQDGSVNLFAASCVGGYLGPNRSPSVLWRLNDELHPIGEYWHYGTFRAYLLNKTENKERKIALVGSDDLKDMSGNAFVFLAILSPTKLVGSGESSHTRGFGFKSSPAELYYVKFPKTDLDKALGIMPGSMIPWISKDSTFYVRVHGDMGSQNAFGFDYIFDSRNMKVLQVKFIGPTEQTYAKLKTEGKLHGTFDKEYLENLKNSVEYWTGEKWVRQPTKIIRSN